MAGRLTRKDLYQLVIEEIEKNEQFSNLNTRDKQLTRSTVAPFSMYSGSASTISTNDLITTLKSILAIALPSRIIEGLRVTASDPASATINIEAGSGSVAGEVFTLEEDTTLDVPLSTNSTEVLYVTLYNGILQLSPTESSNKLTIAKIVIPAPGVTDKIIDKSDGGLDGYIVNYRPVTLYEDGNGFLEEDSLEFFRDNIGDILADNLIGNIRLSENLKIINTAGTAEFNSDSVIFYNVDGEELAHYGATEAAIGNMLITPHTFQSNNYVANASGFVIYDNGDAEFNSIRLRGTLYTSVIAENLYINPGIKIIGDINLDQSDLWVDVDQKIGYDYDEGKDTYLTYNSSTDYLEVWVDGALRVQM